MSTLTELPPGVTHRLVLLRHGEPSERARGRCYGKLDVGLSEAGRAQVRAVGARLAGSSFASIYASPRVRARESAALLGLCSPEAVRVDPRFSELDFGEFEGLRYEEVEARYPEAYAEWMRSPTTMRFPKGESFAQMQARVLAGVAELRERHAGEAVLLASHGGVGRIILAAALAMADADIFRIGQDYANLSWIDHYGDTPIVRGLNWTPDQPR